VERRIKNIFSNTCFSIVVGYRIPNKSFFNLVWKTLYASAKDIAIRIESMKKDKAPAKKEKRK